MRVSSLTLRNLRRYVHLELEVPPGVVLIYGANGAGKTTLLEALYVALFGASFRPGTTTAALIRHEMESAEIATSVVGDERELTIHTTLSRSGRTKRQLNGSTIATRQPAGLNTAVTVFTPDDLELAKGPAEMRRRYLDDIAGFLVPRIDALQTDYERVVRHRNAILKSGGDPVSEEVFDAQLATVGAEVTRARLRLIQRLNPLISDAYQRISGLEDEVVLEYRSEWITDGAHSVEDLAENLRAAIAAKREQEHQRGMTLVGPHRDDVLGWIGRTPVRNEASQGEQRCFALALRLASHHFLAEQMGSEPILLLDDVFSELDGDRSERLLAELASPQTLVTRAGNPSTEIPYDAKLFVSDGRAQWA